MIKDDTRQTIKFVSWLIGILLMLYLVTVAIFYRAGRPVRSQVHELNSIALAKTPITTIEKNYHLNRGINSYALKGAGKNKQHYYFIYLPGSKKAYLLPAKKGVSEQVIRQKFTAKWPYKKIQAVNLGWDHGRAVWEVTGQTKNGNYTYQLYEFKQGNLIG